VSTRSIIAVPHGDSWRGRYVHSDGYPTWRARNLWVLVKRGGLEQTRKVLTEDHFGWSQVDDNQPAGEGRADGRWVIVPGWGEAYTPEEHPSDRWYTPEDYGDTEWTYILGDDGLRVLKQGAFGSATSVLIGTYRWDEDEPNWEAVEKEGYAQ
jgi:hypothetical protein